MLAQISTEDKNPNVTSPYYIFKYSIRSELTRKYYERRIRTFFDFIGFLPNSELEKRCNIFPQKAKKNNEWAFEGLNNASNIAHIEKAAERTISDFIPFLPFANNVNMLDYLFKGFGVIALGLTAIALRRRFERRFRH